MRQQQSGNSPPEEHNVSAGSWTAICCEEVKLNNPKLKLLLGRGSI